MSSPSSQIDVYDAPPRCPVTRRLPLTYMAAVMTAADKGAPIQERYYPYSCNVGWVESMPQWNWMAYDYRINPASRPVAPEAPAFKEGDWVVTTWRRNEAMRVIQVVHGVVRVAHVSTPYSPDQLVLAEPDRIKAALLAEAEAMGFKVGARVIVPSPCVAFLVDGLGVWQPGERIAAHADHIIREAQKGAPFVYASIRLAAGGGAYSVVPLSMLKLAPAPVVKRVPLTAADLTGVSLWLRNPSSPATHSLIVATSDRDIGCPYLSTLCGGFWVPSTYYTLMHQGLEWSSDRVTWRPCYREVTESTNVPWII